MKKSELQGWQKVFSFTFIQNYKSKSAVIGLVLMCTLVIFSGPLMSLVAGSAAADKLAELGECKIEDMYIKNDTDYDFDTSAFKEKYPSYNKINYIETNESTEELRKNLGEDGLRNIVFHISFDGEKYIMSFVKAKDSEISTMDAGVFSDNAREFFFDSRMAQCGVSEEAVNYINSEKESSVVDISEISDDSENDELNPVVMMSVTIYAVIIMMIVLVSSQQIAVSLVTEKSSKVMETLLLSVRPLAIIVGKITGTMAVLICNFVLFIISGCISGIITSVMFSKKFDEVLSVTLEKMAAEDFSAQADPTALAGLSISPGRIIFGIFAVVFTTIIAYLFYAVISGITGASCSSMEDLQSGSAFISLSTLLGIYMVMGAAMANSPVFDKVTYFFPFSGIYVVPIHYIFGKAGLLDLVIIWAEIIILTVLLFRFTANIYQALVYHKGERLKLKDIIRLSKARKGQG